MTSARILTCRSELIPRAAVNAVAPDRPIHAVGYCLGGTLLAVAAAALGQRCNRPLTYIAFGTARFADAGELIDESEVTFLEDLDVASAGSLRRDKWPVPSSHVWSVTLLGGRTPMSARPRAATSLTTEGKGSNKCREGMLTNLAPLGP